MLTHYITLGGTMWRRRFFSVKEKNHKEEKPSDEVMNRKCFIHFSRYNIG